MTRVRYLKFRVYAGPKVGSGLFVYARIFATKREMLAALRAEGEVSGDRYSRYTDGAMVSYKRTVYKGKGRPGRTTACIGTVNLFKSRLGTEVVTHEFAHAMFAWADRKGLLRAKMDRQLDMATMEEPMCYALGRMCRRFVARAVKLGLYDAD